MKFFIFSIGTDSRDTENVALEITQMFIYKTIQNLLQSRISISAPCTRWFRALVIIIFSTAQTNYTFGNRVEESAGMPGSACS